MGMGQSVSVSVSVCVSVSPIHFLKTIEYFNCNSSRRVNQLRFPCTTKGLNLSQWPTEGGGLGGSTPPSKFRRPSKIVPKSTRFENC